MSNQNSHFEKTCIAIETALSKEVRPLSENELCKIVKKRKQNFTKALRELLDTKGITRSGCGSKGDPYLYSVTSKDVTKQTLSENQNEDNELIELII